MGLTGDWKASSVDDSGPSCIECGHTLRTVRDKDNGAHWLCIQAWNENNPHVGPDASSGEYFEGSGSSNFGNHNGQSDGEW